MATPILVGEDVELGREVFEALRKDEALRVRAALWWYDQESREWRYLIATPEYYERGPKAAYLRVRSALKKAGLLPRLPLRRVIVTHPADQLVRGLSGFIVTEGPPPWEIGIYDCSFNDLVIAGMLIYYSEGLLVPPLRSTPKSTTSKKHKPKPSLRRKAGHKQAVRS